MDLETRRFDFTEFFKLSAKCLFSRHFLDKISSNDANLQNMTSTKELNYTDLEARLFKLILQDDKAQLVAHSKRLFTEGDSPVDRSIVSKLLHLCCAYDSVDCATSLVNGELGTVPLVNEVDHTAGLSPLHAAAEAHAARCIELLLKRRARTDLRCRDGRGLLPLELCLSSRRMDVIWNPDDYSLEDLVVLLREKDLTAVKLLSEKTKEVDEVAYANAIGGRIIPLAALLIVAAEKVNEATLVLHDADLGSKEKTTIYECVIREALSYGQAATTSSRVAAKRTSSPRQSESAEKRKLLLCEIELLQLFGAVAQRDRTDKKLTSPLIRATQAGDEAVIELLLKRNIDVNDTDAEGNSALHWSFKTSWGSSSQQIKIVWLLMKHGSRLSQRNKLGLTAFHFAAANGNSEALQVFLLANPDSVNSKTEMKETPLFFAVKNDHMDCVELLLRWGANSEVHNLRRQRPVDLAKSQEMRFMLSPTNISLMNRTSPVQQKHTAWLHGDEVITETCNALLSMTDENTTPESKFSSTKAEICKYFESPTGCVRGSKCFYAHGEEELRQMKQGSHVVHSPAAQELKRKIFVGGLPPSMDSDSLGEFFEEQFGSVEDAVVSGVQTGNHIQSRGFGFVTFKHEKSVEEAVQAHYVTIMGKKIEIKSAVRKSILLDELQKFSLGQHEKKQSDQYEQEAQSPSEKSTAETPSWNTTEEAKPENMSWVDRVLLGQPKTRSTESQAQDIVDNSMPPWLKIFRKWIPCFLLEVSGHAREGGYPLSSLKGDFRAAFGLELDHGSLGYQKLSDFMKSFPDLCRIEVMPIGRRGPATHMILSPCLSKPRGQLLQSLKLRCLPSNEENGNNGDGDSNDTNCLQDLLSVSYGNVSFLSCSIKNGKPSQEAHEENSAQNLAKRNSSQKDTSAGAYSRFLQFLKPEPLFHAQSLLYTDYEREGIDGFKGRKLMNQQRHLVLETLARKRNNTSVFFLREFDFHYSHSASIKQGKCFWCNQYKLLWANFPCGHRLWCRDCKLKVAETAGNFEHKCVVCDVKVQKFIMIPSCIPSAFM